MDDLGGAAPVRVQRDSLGSLLAEVAPDGREEPTIGIAEAVDALLGIPDEEAVLPIAHGLAQQREEVLVLHLARVLELVDHVVRYARADPLVEEGRLPWVDMPQQVGDQRRRVTQYAEALGIAQRVQLLLDLDEETVEAQLLEHRCHGLEARGMVAAELVEGLPELC